MLKKMSWVLLMLVICAGSGFSMVYMELKDALAGAFPKDSKFFKNDAEMTDEKAKIVNDACKTFYRKGDKVTIYVAKDANTNIIGFCMVTVKILSPYASMHRIAYLFDGKKNLTQIAILELSDAKSYAYKINDKGFLEQFYKIKDLSKSVWGKGIDAVSGATESSQLLFDNLKSSLYILNQFY
jgi:hypothetical protein